MANKTLVDQGYINHVALVLDMSGSMRPRAASLIEAVDGLVKHMALRSQEMNQETRVTIYIFDYSTNIQCVVYDKDVLRLPSIKEHYKPYGMTALVDATAKAMNDLKKTPELYGDHAYLLYAFTDGLENDSLMQASGLGAMIRMLPENWTVAALVPDQAGVREAKKQGFGDNIAVWDAMSQGGVKAAGETIRQATDSFMQGRASGVRGTKSLFSMAPDVVNAETIKAVGLKPLVKGSFKMVVVPPAMNDYQIRDFIQGCGLPFQVYQNFYQLMKPEKVQGDKVLAIVHKKTREVFMGEAVRKLVGLPDSETRVSPEVNKEYDVYVQSGSVNRKVKVGQNFLVTGLVNQ